MAYNRGVSLTQIHPSSGADAETDIDIIAIHGLDTKSPDTWVSKSNYPNEDANWLACPRMLPGRIGPARIFTCDWPAELLEQPDLIQKTAEEFARLLLAGIKRRPLPTKTSYAKGKDRPIVFIASCLGGIILIKALVMATHSSEYAIVRQSTRGIVFLATPFRGTSFQDVADWAEPGLRAWASIRGQKVSNLLDNVKGSTFHLEELVRNFTQLCHDKDYPCQVVTFYELGFTSLHRKFPLSWLIPSGVLDLAVPSKPLVDSSSATLDIVTDPLPLNRRHVMMNKFSGPEDPDYQCVVGKIEEILQNIRTNSPLDDADAWIRNKHYAIDRLKIERLSGDLLPMDQCYINLAVVEQPGQGSDKPMTENGKASPFSIFNRQKIETPDTAFQVELATIFNQRQNRNREMIQPRRILIRGRAGVGKTTLCKKIVHEFTQGTWSGWNDLFDRILWIPLRNLKLEERRQHPAYDFEALFTHEYFSLPNNKPDLAKYLAQALESSSSRTLFLLDGLDEVSQELAGNNSMSRFLNELLEQPNILVTSRPSGRLPLKLDLELEAVGFYPDQVKSYIEKTFSNPTTNEIDGKTVDKIQSFLHNHWLIQGLVRIPIQLDALCYSWNDIRSDMPETMTALYQAIELSLWKKDIVRLEKKHNDRLVTLYHIQDASQKRTEENVQDEISFLESLAFAGLYSDIIEFEPKHLNFISDRFSGFLLGKAALSLSFLRASNPSSEYRNRSYHFIHLTFQEYFAARYFVRQWTAREHLSSVELSSRKVNKIEPAKFFQSHKYTSRYDILWRFVAGLLDAEPEELSLFFQNIEGEPLDLLGPAHQRLVMHCLSEVTSNILLRTDIEQRLSKWLLFECEITGLQHSCLAREVEFPERALDTAFRKGSDFIKKLILESLSISHRTTASDSILEEAISWLGHIDNGIQGAAISALQQQALPTKILRIVAAKLEDEDENIRISAIEILGKQSPTEILEVTAARLDEDRTVQKSAILSLGQQSVLPSGILKAIAAHLEDKGPAVRHAAARALGERLDLPDEILKALAASLEDESFPVRSAAVEALARRLALPSEIFEALAARLEDKDWEVRRVAAWALAQRSNLPDEILEALVARLKDENKYVRGAAVTALGQQLVLTDKILQAIAVQLEDEDWMIRGAAWRILNHKQPSQPRRNIEEIATQFNIKGWLILQAAFGDLDQHISLSGEVLKAIVAQLEDDGTTVTQMIVALKALRNQANLPSEIVQAIAAQIQDNKDKHVQLSAIKALGSQSNLPSEILYALEAQVKTVEVGRYELVIQTSVLEIFGNQSRLPSEILDAIASWLKDDAFTNRITAIKALGSQPTLPKKYLYDIAAQLNDDSFSVRKLAESTLRKRKEFYPTLLEGPYAPSLYKLLLQRSFEEDLSWCVDDDGSSVINMPGDGGRFVLGEEYDVRAIVKKIRPANYPAI